MKFLEPIARSVANPIAARRGPLRRPVVQISGRLSVGEAGAAYAAVCARDVILDWLENKQGVALPSTARKGGSFSIDAADGHPVAAVQFDEIWSIQFDKFDPQVGGRIWRTEATIAHGDVFALLGTRLAVIDSAQPADFTTSVPAFVGALIGKHGLSDHDGTPLLARALEAHEFGVGWLIDLLTSEKRRSPVVVLSEARYCDAKADALAMAKRVSGLAHVVVIDEPQSAALIRLVGRDMAVWNGAVRTYNPGFSTAADDPNLHPIATREWLSRRFKKFDFFASAVQHALAVQTVRRPDLEEDVPTFRSIEQAVLEKRISKIGQDSSSERELLLDAQLALHSQKIAELTSQYAYAADEVTQAEIERDQYRAITASLRAQNDHLKTLVSSDAQKIEYPDSFQEIDGWVSTHFAGRLLLLPRAGRAAKKSPFVDPSFVYRCLEILATAYVDSRRGGADAGKLFESIGVHLERTGDPDHLRQWKEHYFVSHRGQTRFFEWHLKRGSDKNDTNTMRVYFFYDDDDEQVVIGSLPGHLPNAKS